MFTPLNQLPTLHILFKLIILVYSVQDLLVQGGGGEHTLKLKMVMTPFSQFFTGNKFALKHVSMMRMCNKIKTKAGLFP